MQIAGCERQPCFGLVPNVIFDGLQNFRLLCDITIELTTHDLLNV